jgi:hypothetical protein
MYSKTTLRCNRHLVALAVIVIVGSLSVAACSPSDPTWRTISIVGPDPLPYAPPQQYDRVWPKAHPDGHFGHEDPCCTPAPDECPPDWVPEYNGWNWVCDDPKL